MTHRIGDLNEATAALAYFNAFHDAFISTLTISSRDRFEDRHTQVHGEALSITIVLAHNNYQDGAPPADQRIEARFLGVMDVAIDFTGLGHDWSVNHLAFEEVQRTLEDGRTTGCLAVVVAQSRLNAERQWAIHQDVRFTFEHAEIGELPR